MDYDALFKRRDAAARRIQAAWRAYKGRKSFLRLRDAAGRIQAAAKGWYVRKQVQDQRNRQQLEQRFEAVMDKHRKKMRVLELEKRALLALPGGDVEEYEQRRLLAAIKVQAHWRGLVARRKLARSPERAQREQAARRIQAAFRNVLRSHRTFTALASTAASAAAGLRGLAGGASPPGRPSPGSALRQSGASVLMGSPELKGSPAEGAGGGGGSRGPSPQRRGVLAPQGMPAEGAGPGQAMRNAAVMGTRRYKELQAQVDGKLSAYMALAKSRGSHRRPDPRVAEARLAALLHDHNVSAPERLAAVAGRQRNLVLMDTLCGQLEQLRPLADLPPDAAPQDFPRPARGSERAERAAQAHALSLAEAKIGNRWWTHLRALNTQAVQDSLTAEDQERWEALDARWRRKWKEVEEQENRRPDAAEELKGGQRTGVGAAAVAAAREAAAMQSKRDEYTERMARAPAAVPVTAPAPARSAGVGP
ncbi:hypothetical protein PLESTB_001576100 [Pleodorina starrii]|uniref:Uncharacterized protein n=1 Tax=Pleodorina starrii TaxID=330485 RepID=A0A9W6F8W7_9CHLO|nr:hypothetical protein PLESTM_000881000 [Pleodorina starrii]GLC60120.1 hypothetical protein PLESTB_001576100 [Pleodorina starrii]GLC68980.1 hypothetical protein PLESTF_000765900 [Pleodorina starrii]